MNDNQMKNTVKAVECGDCETCGKCDTNAAPQEGQNLYTMIIYSENFAGMLNQVTAVFTRRQVNIETLNVCASSTPGVHKYTITCYCTREMAKMITKQIEKKIDVLQANYFQDEDIYTIEACLLKIKTPILLENHNVSKVVRKHAARIVEVNPTYSIVEKKGTTEEILSLYDSLHALDVILQFVRTGRIAVTKSKVERLNQYLEERELDK